MITGDFEQVPVNIAYDANDQCSAISWNCRRQNIWSTSQNKNWWSAPQQHLHGIIQAAEQECLLNKKHPNYVKKGLKESLWEQKAGEMGKTGDQLKKWYANMRSRFGKLSSLRFWQQWTDFTGQLHPVPLQISQVLPHSPVQEKGHSQCKSFI